MIKKKNNKNQVRYYIKDSIAFKSLKNKISKKNKSKKIFYAGGLRLKGLFKKGFKNNPLISIVMPNFKSKNLSKSIISVLRQNYPNVELIVIDGNSGNLNLKILKKFNNQIDYWISENDKGMWDAWNKGFKLSRGNFVGIVDSSNILYPDACKILSKYVNKYKDIDFVCGTVRKDGKIYTGFRPQDIYKQFNIIPSSIVGFYIKLKSLKKVGLLNIKYKIQADYDLLYRLIVKKKFNGISTKGNEIFGDLGVSEFSKKHSFFETLFNELNIRFNNGQNIFMLIYILFGRSVKKFIKFI